MDQDSIKKLLKEALESNTERVKEATTKLKRDYYKNPQSLALLLQIATDDDVSNDVRQSAATQVLPLVQRHWANVPDSHKPQIRKHVLESTLEEESPLVRHSCARVVATIAKQDAEDGEWADLPQTLVKVSTSADATQREVGTYILFAILDTMAEESSSQFGALFQLYGKTIQDPESADVQINSMLGLSKMALYINPDEDKKSLQAFQKLVPQMVAVLKQAMDAHDEERELQGFEVFQTLLEAPAPVLNQHFGDLVKFMIEAASASSLDKDARVAALNFLVSCVMYRKTKFQALRVGEKVVESLLQVLFSTEESADDQEEYGLTMSVLTMLNLMSSQLPPSQAVVPVLDQFKKYASGESRQRQVVLMALGASVEGAPEFLDTQIEGLKPYILQLLNDPELKVREQAVNATKELAEALPESLGKDHEKFMAGLAKNLNAAMSGLDGADGKTNLEVVVACCGAIDYLVDGMEPEALKQYLSELVPHMSKLFSHSDNKVQRASIAAVGSIAESAKENFQPFFKDTMLALQDFVQLKDSKEDLDIRNVTCDAMGDIALAVGAEAFQPYVQPLMRNTEDGLTLEDPSLKETSYLFWGKMAKVYKEEFKTFLPGVVKIIIEALEQQEADVDFDIEGDGDLVDAEVMVAGKKVKVVAANDESDDDVGDWDDDDDDSMDLHAISAVAQEKEFAAEALADIFSHTGKEFVPYYEKTITTILPLVESSYEGLRRAVASVLFRAYVSMWQLSNEDWEAGLPVKKKPSGELAKFGEILMTTTLAMWMAEDDPAVCMEIHRNLAETLKETGPAILAGSEVVEQIVQTLLSIMQKKHLCQQTLDSDDEDEEMESSEDEQWLIESAMDAVAGLATALGPQFGEIWKIFNKIIIGFASATESTQRSAAIGAIAECIRGMGAGCTEYTTPLLKIILHRLSDEDSEVKSNAAFAAGMLVEKSDDAATIKKAYPTILSKLEPMLGASEKRQLDNAAGCVARMIMRHQDALPLAEVLPALVKLLPLKEDWEENTPICDCLYQLFDERNEVVASLKPQLRVFFQHVLGPPEDQLNDESRKKVEQMAQFC